MQSTHNKIRLADPTLKEEVLEEIALLERQGFSQREIGNLVERRFGFTLTHSTIGIYSRQIRKRYQESVLANSTELIHLKLNQFQDIRRECWKAYYKSCDDSERITEEEVNPDMLVMQSAKQGYKGQLGELANDLKLMRKIIVREGRLPGNEYLNTIIKTLQAECDLLGLTSSITVQQNTVSINLLDRLSAKPNDPLEEAKQRAIRALAGPSDAGSGAVADGDVLRAAAGDDNVSEGQR